MGFNGAVELSGELQLLIQLQEINFKILTLHKRVLEIPDELENREQSLQRANNSVKLIQEQLDQKATHRRSLEGEVQLLREKLTRYKDQLMVVKTNREYQAMLLEITTTEEEISRKEDETLEAMMAVDELEENKRQASQFFKQETLTVSSKKKELEAFSVQFDKDMASYEQERSQLEENLPDSLLQQYQRIASVHKGQALAQVAHGSCQACNVRLRPQLFTDLKTNLRIVTCESCSRILYQSCL